MRIERHNTKGPKGRHLLATLKVWTPTLAAMLRLAKSLIDLLRAAGWWPT